MNADGASGHGTGLTDLVTPSPATVRTHAQAVASSALPKPSPSSPDEPAGVSSPSSSALEARLLQQAQAGDRAAFGQFVLATQHRLYTLLTRIVGDRDEARELCQETYLKALVGLKGFRHNSHPYTWVYRIAVNLAVARLRKVRRHRVFSLDPASPAHDRTAPSGSPQDQLLSRERDRQVILALGKLDSEYRAVIVLRDIDGLDYKDISDVLELPIGTVKSRLFRARLALREELNRYLSPGSKSPAQGSSAPPDGVGTAPAHSTLFPKPGGARS